MNDEQLEKLEQDLREQIKSGATTDEIEEWADAYAFSRRDLIEVIRRQMTRGI